MSLTPNDILRATLRHGGSKVKLDLEIWKSGNVEIWESEISTFQISKFPHNRAVLLAGDIGGTKTLLGLYEEARDRPSQIEVGEFVTLDYDSVVPMIREFLKAEGVEPAKIRSATFGVAGAVSDQVARLTNVPWLVDGEAIAEAASLGHVHILNDLQAMAYSVPVLEPSELEFLQHGVAQAKGNAAV